PYSPFFPYTTHFRSSYRRKRVEFGFAIFRWPDDHCVIAKLRNRGHRRYDNWCELWAQPEVKLNYIWRSRGDTNELGAVENRRPCATRSYDRSGSCHDR